MMNKNDLIKKNFYYRKGYSAGFKDALNMLKYCMSDIEATAKIIEELARESEND